MFFSNATIATALPAQPLFPYIYIYIYPHILYTVYTYLCRISGGLVEIPSYVITWYAMDRLGRRWVLCLTMLLGGLACVSCMFVPEGNENFVFPLRL